MYDKCNLFIGSLEYTYLILFKSLTQFGYGILLLLSSLKSIKIGNGQGSQLQSLVLFIVSGPLASANHTIGRWPLTLISIASLLLLLLLLFQVVGRAGRNGGRLIRYGDEAIIVGLRRNFFSFSFSRRFFIFIQFHDVIAFF